MSETPFAKFIALVHIDQQINTLSRSIKESESQNVQLQAAIVKNNESLEKSKHMLLDIRKEVSNKELEMKILDEQEAQKKNRLETVSNHKEYQPIKAEIDQLKRQQHELEEGLVGAWNKLENSKKNTMQR